MTKINGKIQIERDDVGEAIRVDKRKFARACELFFAKRGLPKLDFKDMIHSHAEELKRRKKHYEGEQDAEEDWIPAWAATDVASD